MANRIKGITIEIGGDTTKLDKSLKGVNSTIKQSQTKLRDINKLLKLDPSNVELLKQKQDTLKTALSASEQKTKELREAIAKLKESGGEKAAEQIQALEREIIETENEAKKFQKELNALGNIKFTALGARMKEVGASMKQAGESMRYISTAAAGALASLGGIAYKAGMAADDINTLSKVTHISTKDLQLYAGASELVDVSLETMANAHKKLTKAMSSAKGGTGAAADTFKALGVAVTDANGNLRNSNDVFNDAINALSKIDNEAERDAMAMTLFGKSATDLNPLIQGGSETLEKFTKKAEEMGLVLDQDAVDAANNFKDTIDETKAITGMAFNKMGASLAKTLQPALEKVAGFVVKLANAFSNLSPTAQKIILIVGGITAALAPVLIVLGTVISSIGSIVGALGMLGPAIAFITGPIGIAIAAVVGLIAVFALIIKNVDKIKAFLAKAWNTIANTAKAALKAVGNAIAQPFIDGYNRIVAVVNLIKSAVAKIKSIINGVKLKLDLKLPKVSVSGGKAPWGIGGKGTLPSFKVHWAAKGGIVDGATLIGAGEKGKEAIVPLDPFWNRMDSMSVDIVNAISRGFMMANAGGGTVDVVVNLGGAKVGEQIVKLYDRSKLALG